MSDQIDLPKTAQLVPEDLSRLMVLPAQRHSSDINLIIESLKRDQVILVQNIDSDSADNLMLAIAAQLGLSESLKMQALFASSLGHRKNSGRYYMSVNKRSDYQFIPPHSEGSHFTNMQLASFYCHENSTDGGETILMNVNQSSPVWQSLRERVNRGKANRALTLAETNQIKVMLKLQMPEDTLKEDDEILSQKVVTPGFTVFDVLTKPQKTHSLLLDQELYVYWDTIASIDHDSAQEFNRLLTAHDLLKLPADSSINGSNIEKLDNAAPSRIRQFGSQYDQLFHCKITHKLKPGDFIIQNNLSWAHSVNNWTPSSGERKVTAAFA